MEGKVRAKKPACARRSLATKACLHPPEEHVRAGGGGPCWPSAQRL
eukprot:CAMPEP_0197682506 /NCGR_PEP_ID=MMETSP1338-20131121/96555_1 /TAXON_ID=43686 ORGANISM="Pelagodinium beii, Strain RCC1491" /NCGR_SAMPLE_ID=MMETSP1338 /ASSEMBLY_ACC=CAM_ASM_000754 /LENGTH=45 /DNA_ID= /DNA_START= /DNA_END= /DNA_ORIENTATION=